MLQDRLEDYIDVSVGDANKINPSFLVEERLDYLIIGDVISDATPSVEIQNWLLKYLETSKQKNYQGIKAISGFYVIRAENKTEPFWIEFLQDNVEHEIIYPPILRLRLDQGELALENGANVIVKEYSDDFVEFMINNEKSIRNKGM
ncbi:MAG: hypothetical protein ACW986_09920 [Promethearchaeota archaeon]|jgi:hypothetical protein